MTLPQLTLDDYNHQFADRHLLHGAVAKWAKERPEAIALVSAETGRTVTWSEFNRFTTALAREWLRLGYKKGDYLVTLLPMSLDHVLLEYSLFKIGVIVVPLDLRLPAVEVLRVVEMLRPRGFVCLGLYGAIDFRELGRAVRAKCSFIEHFFTVSSAEPDDGFRSYAELAEAASHTAANTPDAGATELAAAASAIAEEDGALVIFTTGSTGSPKAALLTHRNITSQNMCLCGAFFGGDSGTRSLVNLPASHVGAQTEILMSTLFGGGTAVLLEVFDAGRSLRAIEQHRVELLGQIPVMFSLEWMLKDYDRFDLTSLKFAAYGGNAVSRPFVDKLATMAPVVGTGLGLTECAGFCTYVSVDGSEREKILGGLGHDMPAYPCTIRQPMRDDGLAGEALPDGEIGHLCFRGPQTFAGYVNDPEATARTISRDGYLYTGDLGYRTAAGLHLSGRAKWVIKSFGYQVFPGDVEAHIADLAQKIMSCIVIGVAHEVAGEGVVAVVEKRPGVELTVQELERHTRSLATYMRPRHWIIVEPGQMPLNRLGKPDHQRAQEMARQEIAALRARGEWDSRHTNGG
ncbi:MAG TPA: class I adenylate-forming enzyme family protein [Terracidiphilus sp.]|nr:class I adenylate-forming enzyme family protein [Terracidiphilus sp.]